MILCIYIYILYTYYRKVQQRSGCPNITSMRDKQASNIEHDLDVQDFPTVHRKIVQTLTNGFCKVLLKLHTYDFVRVAGRNIHKSNAVNAMYNKTVCWT